MLGALGQYKSWENFFLPVREKRSKKDVKDGALYLECLNKDHRNVGGVDQNGTVI